ncbi:MAG: hypothetical protein HFJ45_09545 [Clostridia bacterium]|nr:hypothetical protein [Clostridia bacterium]
MEDLEKNQKKTKTRIIISIVLTILIILVAAYLTNNKFRNFIDNKFFNKQVKENFLDYIEINSDDNPTVFAYDNYIGVLSKNIFYIYNNKGNLENDLSINISSPLVYTNGKYVIISEKNGSNFYVINSTSLLWQGTVDGKINKININSNGYISAIASNSTYNSIVIVFNNNGDELFKTFFHSTYAMCSTISNSNEYIAIGEIDYSGTVIKSNIRIMSLANAELVYNFSAPSNEIITNINYIDKNIAICSFSGSIYKITTSSGDKVCDITDNILFANIDMKNTLALVEKQSSGLFSYEYQLKLKNLSSNNENLYILNNSYPKQTTASGKIIALNYGTSVDIVNQNGTLKKNYTSSQQIKDVIVGEHIVGIVYKDKIEIIDL